MKSHLRIVCLCLIICVGTTARAGTYQHLRIGNKADVQTKPQAGIAMIGGGTDLDEAFRWLCEKGNGGDFLILRARGGDDYNSYVNGLCKANSVATLIISDREAAGENGVADIIRHAEVIFIAGGDQANYIRAWKGTPVQTAINDDIAAGKPVGGTSAGLAVLGEFVYGALGDKPDDKDLSSAQVLADPYFDRVTLVRDFLKVPGLENLITDSHFAKRDRMGRTLGFLARIMKDGWSASPREVAIDERSAVLVEADGRSIVIGTGRGAYFLRPGEAPQTCEKGAPLTFREVRVDHVQSGGHWNFRFWRGDATTYTLSVVDGKIQSTQADEAIY